MKQNNVVVIYTIRPEAKEEHIRLIKGVFAQLDAEKLDDVDYQVMCLEDGVTFVHMSSANTPDGSSPLPQLSAFKEFNKDIGSRVATQPMPSSSTLIGNYHHKR